MKYAVIENNKVVNIVVAESALESNWVQSNNAKIGDDYNNGEFVTPLIDNTEINKQIVRERRNALLLQSDWTQLYDSKVDRQVWEVYRQALRDIPQQPGFPTEIIWPSEP